MKKEINAHSPVHIEIFAVRCNAVDELKDKKDGTIIFRRVP